MVHIGVLLVVRVAIIIYPIDIVHSVILPSLSIEVPLSALLCSSSLFILPDTRHDLTNSLCYFAFSFHCTLIFINTFLSLLPAVLFPYIHIVDFC